MLRFLRHFRQRYLERNHFGRYLLYALGEVLLALQVNNWNEQREKTGMNWNC